MQVKIIKAVAASVIASAALWITGNTQAQFHDAAAPASVNQAWISLKKPVWLTDLSLEVKESYDDNILGVCGLQLQPKSTWITTVSPRLGFNFVPLLGNQNTLKTFSLNYTPDFAIYHSAPAENYNAHKFGNSINGKIDDFSFSLDNAFLFNDGSKQAPIYALDQGSNVSDKNRSAYATGMPRERRSQIQDRSTIVFQYDRGNFFVRPTASLLYYDLMTDWHLTTVAPYKGYQNYEDRYDVNGGVDLGYKVWPEMALTIGYRYGHQYQQQFTPAVDALYTHYSSNDYQRVLFGFEGKPLKWLDVKFAGGPDFRSYNPNAPVSNLNQTRYYGEATVKALLPYDQSVTFSYKQWQWVSSTGRVPDYESNYALSYHWDVTKQLGFDLGGKLVSADYNSGNEAVYSARYDAVYTISTGLSYAFNANLSASLAYYYDFGRNEEYGVPSPPGAAYREYDHQLVSLGIKFKF